MAAAEAYRRHVLGVDDLVFGKALSKLHKPLTRRRNTGGDYHRCASVYVRRGTELLEQVEGWTVGALLGSGGALAEGPMPGRRSGRMREVHHRDLDKQSAVG